MLYLTGSGRDMGAVDPICYRCCVRPPVRPLTNDYWEIVAVVVVVVAVVV